MMSEYDIERVYRQIKENYMYYPRVSIEVTTIRKQYPFQPLVRMSPERILLCAMNGTVPVMYQGKTYRIPICIMFPYDYPMSPPYFFADPTREMEVAKSCPYVNPMDCSIHHPILQGWNSSLNCLTVITTLIGEFNVHCPLKMKQIPEKSGRNVATIPSSDKSRANGYMSNGNATMYNTNTYNLPPPMSKSAFSCFGNGCCGNNGYGMFKHNETYRLPPNTTSFLQTWRQQMNRSNEMNERNHFTSSTPQCMSQQQLPSLSTYSDISFSTSAPSKSMTRSMNSQFDNNEKRSLPSFEELLNSQQSGNGVKPLPPLPPLQTYKFPTL